MYISFFFHCIEGDLGKSDPSENSQRWFKEFISREPIVIFNLKTSRVLYILLKEFLQKVKNNSFSQFSSTVHEKISENNKSKI
jgi:hypothetical protein